MQARSMPDLSIIIVNYKTPQLIVDCLESIYQHTTGLTIEIIIVDNDSEDTNRQIVLDRFPSIHWIEMGYNSGFSRANNRGIDASTGRLLLLLNSDTLVVDNVLKRCADLLDDRPEVAAVGPMQIDRKGNVHVEAYHSFSQLLRFYLILPGSQLIRQLLDRLIPETKYSDPEQVDFLIGSFIMTRQTVVKKAGKLDENFFMYSEDIEWCYRLQQYGKLLLLRDAFYIHLEYGSSSEYQQTQITHINRFKTQMHVSGLLWVRKQYGAGLYLMLILHYISLIPIIFGWKITVNLLNRKPLFFQLNSQWEYTRKVGVFLRFFWKTLFNKTSFYKI